MLISCGGRALLGAKLLWYVLPSEYQVSRQLLLGALVSNSVLQALVPFSTCYEGGKANFKTNSTYFIKKPNR